MARMRRRRGYRDAVILAVALVGTWVVGVACITPAKCDSLRQELYTQRKVWAQGCTPDSGTPQDTNCVIVAGQANDCTGVFLCNIAVLSKYRDNANRLILDIPSKQGTCQDVCSQVNCITAGTPTCDTTTGECFLAGDPVAAPFDAGNSTTTTPIVDAGTNG